MCGGICSMRHSAGTTVTAITTEAIADPVSVRHLRGWISLSGLGSGTPLVRWLRRRPWRWAAIWLILRLRGHSIAALRDGLDRAAWYVQPRALEPTQVL